MKIGDTIKLKFGGHSRLDADAIYAEGYNPESNPAIVVEINPKVEFPYTPYKIKLPSGFTFWIALYEIREVNNQ